jgi:hypothetical protein
MAASRKVASSTRGYSGQGTPSCLRGKRARPHDIHIGIPAKPHMHIPTSPPAIESPELSALFTTEIQPVLELLRRMEHVRRLETWRDAHAKKLSSREGELEKGLEKLGVVEEQHAPFGRLTIKHEAIKERADKLKQRLTQQALTLEKAEKTLASAQEALAVVQAKQTLTPLFEPAVIPKPKVRAVQQRPSMVVWWGLTAPPPLFGVAPAQNLAKAPSKRKARVEALQGLLEQGDLLGFMLGFVPWADALRGLGLASRAWHEAVNGALPHVSVDRRLPPGAPLAERFPSLTSLHIKRLPAGDLPALMGGGLPHRLVRLTSDLWYEDAFCRAFEEFFLASEWPQLEHLGIATPRKLLDKAHAHPALFAQLLSIGVRPSGDLEGLAQAIHAGLLPRLRDVEWGRLISPRFRDVVTIFERLPDVRTLTLNFQYNFRRYLNPQPDLDDADEDGGGAFAVQLFASGVTSRLR